MLISILARANAEVASADHEVIEIPLKEIGWQAVNLGILLFALIYFVKDSVIEAFANRKKQFIEQSEKTKSALQGAELALAGVRLKLQTLEDGEKSALLKATQEAAALRVTLIKESEAQAEKLKADAQMLLVGELEKAKTEVSNLILTKAITATTKGLTDKGVQATKDSEVGFLRQLGQVKT